MGNVSINRVSFLSAFILTYRLPARYFDPVTRLPYNSVQAYRILREAYYQQLEDKGDPSCPPVAAWVAYRKQYKASRAQTNSVTTMTAAAPPQQLCNTLSSNVQPVLSSVAQGIVQGTVLNATSNPHSVSVLGANSNVVNMQQVISSNAVQNSLQQQIVRNSISTNQGLANQGLSGQTLTAALTSLSQQSTQQQQQILPLQQQTGTGVNTARATTIYQHVVGGRNTVVAGGAAGGVRPQLVVVTTGSGVQLVQGGAVQLVQTTAGGAVQLVQSGTGTVQLVQSGSGGSVQLVQSGSGGSVQLVQSGSGGGVQLVQSGTGGAVQLVQSGSGGSMQLVQTSGGGGVQLVQSGTGGGVQLVQGTGGAMQLVQQGGAGVQLVQPGRITLRPMTGQAFTNLQSLLK